MSFMDAQAELTLRNPAYEDALETFIWEAYELDLDRGDISTKTLLGRAGRKVKAKITTNEDGVLAGIQEARWFLSELGVKVLKSRKDGDFLKKGDILMELEGSAKRILAAERTLLNLLQRMSAIASLTKKMSSKLPKGIKLLATRKTLWGALDKRAVAVGGGGTHRLTLSDAILIKENHLALAPNIKKALKKVLKHSSKVRFVEFELESPKQAEEFVEQYMLLRKSLKEKAEVVVMLDNFKPADIKKVIKPLKKAGLHVEVSGGINERNISSYAIGGVTAISSGALTKQAQNLDLSLSIYA